MVRVPSELWVTLRMVCAGRLIAGAGEHGLLGQAAVGGGDGRNVFALGIVRRVGGFDPEIAVDRFRVGRGLSGNAQRREAQGGEGKERIG